MSKRVRFGIFVGILGIGFTIAGFIFLSRLLRTNLAPLPAPTQLAMVMEPVVVTTHDIQMGAVIKAQDVRVMEVPAETAPTGAIPTVEEIVGRYAKVDLVTGEMVLMHNLADPSYVSHDIAYTLEDHQVLMAFPSSDLMSSLSIIQKGDVIDIFITMEQEVRLMASDEVGLAEESYTGDEETITKTMTFDAFQGVSITAMVVDIIEQEGEQAAAPVELPQQGQEGQPAQAPSAQKPQEYAIRSYLLALNPQDALVLKHFKDIGATFDFVVRSPTSKQIFELAPVTTEYLMDRYQFEMPK